MYYYSQFNVNLQPQILKCVVFLFVAAIFLPSKHTLYDTPIYPSRHVAAQHWTLKPIIFMNISSSTSPDMLQLSTLTDLRKLQSEMEIKQL